MGGDAWLRVFALVGSVVLAGVLLIFLQAILVPFILAIFLAYLVRPFAEYISTNLCAWRRARERHRRARDALSREEVKRLLPSAADAARDSAPSVLKPGATLRNLEEATIQIEAALPHWVGVLLAMTLAVVLFASIVLLMAASISSLGSRLDAYQRCGYEPWATVVLDPSLALTLGLTPPSPRRAHELWAIVVFNLKPLGLNLSDTSELPSRAIAAVLTPLLNFSLGLLNYCKSHPSPHLNPNPSSTPRSGGSITATLTPALT